MTLHIGIGQSHILCTLIGIDYICLLIYPGKKCIQPFGRNPKSQGRPPSALSSIGSIHLRMFRIPAQFLCFCFQTGNQRIKLCRLHSHIHGSDQLLFRGDPKLRSVSASASFTAGFRRFFGSSSLTVSEDRRSGIISIGSGLMRSRAVCGIFPGSG